MWYIEEFWAFDDSNVDTQHLSYSGASAFADEELGI